MSINTKVISLILTLQILKFITCIADINLVRFFKYSRQGDINYREEINESNLSESSFKPDTITVFLIHGYVPGPDPKEIQIIIDAYLNSSLGGNYFAVDWSALAGGTLVDYPLVVSVVPSVARRVAAFICWLAESRGLDLTKVHLIGHSLGAHLAGEVGTEIQKYTNGFKLARITGLDPAGPLYWPRDMRNTDKRDAHLVDIIHSNAFLFGEKTTEGSIDFIVNGGTFQPGCNLISFCNHDFSAYLYAASFHVSYFGCKCSNLELEPVTFEQCMTKCQHPVRVGLYTPQKCLYRNHGEVGWSYVPTLNSESSGKMELAPSNLWTKYLQ